MNPVDFSTWAYLSTPGGIPINEEDGQFFFVPSTTDLTSSFGSFVYTPACAPPSLPLIKEGIVSAVAFAPGALARPSAVAMDPIKVKAEPVEVPLSADSDSKSNPVRSKADRVFIRAARGKQRARRDSEEISSDSSSSSPPAQDMSPEGEEDEPVVKQESGHSARRITPGSSAPVGAAAVKKGSAKLSDSAHATRASSRRSSTASATAESVDSESNGRIQDLRVGVTNHCAGSRRRQNHPKCAPMPGNKRERNAVSALNYRKRRKMYMVDLEAKNEELAVMAETQTSKITSLETENKMLKEQLEFFQKFVALSNTTAASALSAPTPVAASPVSKPKPTSLSVTVPSAKRSKRKSLDVSLPMSPPALSEAKSMIQGEPFSAAALSSSASTPVCVDDLDGLSTLPPPSILLSMPSNNSASAIADSDLMLMLPPELGTLAASSSGLAMGSHASLDMPLEDLTAVMEAGDSASSAVSSRSLPSATWEMVDEQDFAAFSVPDSTKSAVSKTDKAPLVSAAPVAAFRHPNSGVFMFTLFSLLLLFVPSLWHQGLSSQATSSVLTYSSPSSPRFSSPAPSLFASLTGVFPSFFSQPDASKSSPTGRKILNSTEMEMDVLGNIPGDDIMSLLDDIASGDPEHLAHDPIISIVAALHSTVRGSSGGANGGSSSVGSAGTARSRQGTPVAA